MSVDNSLQAALFDAHSALIFTHVQEDGDTVGSALALAAFLKEHGKKALVLFDAPLPKNLSFLQGGLVYTEGMPLPEYDLAVAVDCASPDRLGARRALFDAAPKTVVIDHHGTNPCYGTVNWVQGELAAVGLMIYLLFLKTQTAITPEIATMIYTAIFTDTGGFHFSNTDERVLSTGAALLASGADHNKIYNEIYERVSLSRYRLQALAMNNTAFYFDDSVAVICIRWQDFTASGALPEDTENLSSLARTIDGVELAVLLKETEAGEIRSSLRSKAIVDVSAIAKRFGGGGHPRAAGFSSSMDMDKTLQALLSVIGEYI